MRTASSSGMVVTESMSADEVIIFFSFPEILSEGDRVVVAVVVGMGVSGISHNSHVPEGDGEPEYPISISPIRDLDWRSSSDSAAALPMSARQSIKIPSMCSVYFMFS